MLQVRRRLMRPLPDDTEQLRDTDPCSWATSHSELKDVRDLKEVQLLSKLLMNLNTNKLAEAVDLLVMRIREIRTAKGAGGSWEKAAAISLMPSAVTVSTALPDGSMVL